MSEEKTRDSNIEELYADTYWHVNTGGETIHAKRTPGKWRNIKWWAHSVWLIMFLGPYLRWEGRQAVLFDIPERKFQIFSLSVFPQDFWMLSLVLLFFAILLAVVTTMAGRIYCGFFCFQTAWTDLFTLIEDRLEGNPAQRRKLDKAPFDFTKIRIKATKHFLWLVIGALTGIHFAAWFVDVFDLWRGYLTLSAPTVSWIVLGMFTAGTYVLAGWLREQTCFWLCPYARLQGVMVDAESVLTSYDFKRGEPRGRMKKGQDRSETGMGDCVDCGQCVAVCPMGVDIRHGQQEGCINCALCIDACDVVMDKIGFDKGLIRFASLDELEGKPTIPLFKRPRVIVYMTIMVIALIGVVYGAANIASVDLKVLHDRQPLYVQQSDGSIQNRYTLKILNKTQQDMHLKLTAEGLEGIELRGIDEHHVLTAPMGKIEQFTVFVRVPGKNVLAEKQPIRFRIIEADGTHEAKYESYFAGPDK